MKIGPVASDPARLSAGLLALTLVGALTGALPLAGLAAAPRARDHAPSVPTTPPAVPGDPIVHAAATRGPLRLDATLGQRVVWRDDGRVDLVVGVTLDDDVARRAPVDLALVVDTSGSMGGVIALVRRATLGIIERLGPDDRLVLVTYSSDARTVFHGALSPAARAQAEAAVGRFVATGGTNISAGLEAGRAGLRALGAQPGRTSRLLLLSDGAPTVGETSPPALVRAAGALRADGVALSAVGLGLDYGETLMAAMADAGGGAFHHVDGPAALAKVYAAELEDLRAVALRGARLRLVPAPGVEVLGVTAWGAEHAGGEASVWLGDLSLGRALKVVARLKVAPGGARADVVRVRLEGRGEAPALAGEVALETATLSAGVTADAQVARASAVAEVERDLVQADVAERLKGAREAAARGEGERARALVREARARTSDPTLSFEAMGERQDVNLDALADDLAEGAGSERGRRAMKAAMSAERGAGRAR